MFSPQKAAENPRIMAALVEIQKDPWKAAKYAQDPEISSMVKELKNVLEDQGTDDDDDDGGLSVWTLQER